MCIVIVRMSIAPGDNTDGSIQQTASMTRAGCPNVQPRSGLCWLQPEARQGVVRGMPAASCPGVLCGDRGLPEKLICLSLIVCAPTVPRHRVSDCVTPEHGETTKFVYFSAN